MHQLPPVITHDALIEGAPVDSVICAAASATASHVDRSTVSGSRPAAVNWSSLIHRMGVEKT